ncbi:MAG: sulfatase-like hydrolase/transferase [Chitinivibrionales bacterium]|nr:sulfatase-like hydrolase/transferase [Chitinivibrionales bacterium]
MQHTHPPRRATAVNARASMNKGERMPRPNVIVITTHDTGRHLGCYGIDAVHTPNLDAFADQGIRFTNYFAGSALCSPSRGVAMTGRWPQRNGMLGLCHGAYRWRLNDAEKHLSHLLHDAGYYTALIGHQHETTDVDAQLCFDRAGPDFYPNTWEHIHAEDVAAEASDFLRSEAAGHSPFYLQLGFFETHRPFGFGGKQPDTGKGVYIPPYLKGTDAARADLALFQGNVRAMDAAVGTVLDALREAGLDQNTLVVYTVDHGLDLPRAKTTLYDPGIEIALLMRWPRGGIAAHHTCDELLGNVDLVPTILDLIGIGVPDNVDGTSFAALTRGKDDDVRREYHFSMMQGHGMGKEIRAIRTATHKLIRNFEVRSEPVPPVVIGDNDKYTGANKYVTVPPVELYDLTADPLEVNNLADSPAHAGIRDTLDSRLWQWLDEVEDPILKGPIATPYYQRAIADYPGRRESV